MSWARFGRLLRIAYLLRVPTLTLLAIAGLGLAAGTDPSARKLLGGLFDMDGSMDGSGWKIFFVSWAAFQAATAALATINVILQYGDDRFQDPNLTLRQTGDSRGLLTFFAALFPPCLLLYFVWQSTDAPLAKEVGGTLGGFLAAAIVVVLSKFLALFWSDPKPEFEDDRMPYLIFPFHRYENLWLSQRLNAAYKSELSKLRRRIQKWLGPFKQALYQILLPGAQGYFVSMTPPYRVASGHIFMTSLVALSLLVHGLLGWGFYRVIDPEDPSQLWLWQWLSKVPSLAFILLLLMLICFVFGGLSFFADRYRAPVLLSFLLLALTTGLAPEADHFYRAEKVERLELPAPAEALRDKPHPVLVASAGGGIQAAAWTARVLRGLDELCRETLDCRSEEERGRGERIHSRFRSALAAMSGVSGGSAGIMHFGAHWDDPARVMESAAKSSIEHVSWGLLNPDLRRAIFPWWPALRGTLEIDRAWALERAWEMRDSTSETFLHQWGARVRSQRFPAFLFNTTIVEGGAPMVFATTQLEEPAPVEDGLTTRASRLFNFHQRYAGHDVRVTTAARLSASFPYVSPTARSLVRPFSCPDLHLVDGGYYDNYGVHTLLYWLDQAIQGAAPPPQKILVLMIRSFPSPPPAPGERKGCLYQYVAPADAYLNVRDTAQLSRTRRELDLYRRAGIPVEVAQIEFPDFSGDDSSLSADCQEPPLSWKLRQRQIDCIHRGWNRVRCQEDAVKVIQFLAGRRPPSCVP